MLYFFFLSILPAITGSLDANVKLCIQPTCKSDIHAAICVSAYAGLYYDHSWLAGAFISSARRCAVCSAGPLGLSVARNISGWETKGIKGYKSVIPPALLVEAHVALCKPSSSENKDRSYGSSCHKATVQGHWTRRQPPAPCSRGSLLKIISTSSSTVCLSISVLLLYHRSKADLSFWNYAIMIMHLTFLSLKKKKW